jgi:hypothetical protein
MKINGCSALAGKENMGGELEKFGYSGKENPLTMTIVPDKYPSS